MLLIEKKFHLSLVSILGEAYPENRYLLAVSGGSDSMALLELFRALIPVSNISVAHFNHLVRDTSDRDASFIQDYCKKAGIKFYLGYRKGKKVSEDALRKERLFYLNQTKLHSDSKFIVTAHHMEDQLETFLMRLIRGTGVVGLSAMLPKENLSLKPLLKYRKTELHHYLKKKKISFVDDETNFTKKYFRNKIRHDLVPVIEQLSSNYGGSETFYKRFSDLLEELHEIRNQIKLKQKNLFNHMAICTPFWVRLSEKEFEGLSLGDKKILLRKITQKLRTEVLSRESLLRLLSSIENKKSISLQEIFYSNSCGFHFFQNPTSKLLSFDALFKIEFDASLFPEAEIRYFQAGDKMRRTKLKKIFLEQKIPKLERQLIPVLARKNSNDILWHLAQGESPGVRIKKINYPFTFLF